MGECRFPENRSRIIGNTKMHTKNGTLNKNGKQNKGHKDT